MKSLLTLSVLFISLNTIAQTDTSYTKIGIYIEVYQMNAFNQQAIKEKSSIFYNHTTITSPNINLGILSFQKKYHRWEFNADLMLGTYAKKNLSAEPWPWRNLHQLNACLGLSPRQRIQFGIFPSHIGIESAKNWENLSLSRSYIAENSPYYETGIKWEFAPINALNVGLLILNGWQRMADWQPAMGTQLGFDNEKIGKFNANGFVGNQGNGTRIFHNFFFQKKIIPTVQIALSQDIGKEKNAIWHGAAVFLVWQLRKKVRVFGRYEYYEDPKGVLINNGFKDQAGSLGFTIALDKSVKISAELKKSKIFGLELLHSFQWNWEELLK